MEKEESRTEDKHGCKIIVKPEKLSFEAQNITDTQANERKENGGLQWHNTSEFT
jgi:hypothetical protein